MQINGIKIEAEQYLNTEQLAQALGKCKDTLAIDRAKKRGVSYYKIGGRVFYKGEDIISHFESSKVEVIKG